MGGGVWGHAPEGKFGISPPPPPKDKVSIIFSNSSVMSVVEVTLALERMIEMLPLKPFLSRQAFERAFYFVVNPKVTLISRHGPQSKLFCVSSLYYPTFSEILAAKQQGLDNLLPNIAFVLKA